VSEAALRDVVAREVAELERRERVYRDDRPFPHVRDRVVILVDDGLATGATMTAAVAAVRKLDPREIVVAVPVAPPETVAELERVADRCITYVTPLTFFSVGAWYEDFRQTTDDEVCDLLRAARGRQDRAT
jgi:putative phosphoribosyl transferase